MKKAKKLKKLPVFKNENEERDFWSTHDTADFFDLDKVHRYTLDILGALECWNVY
ncbi:MAG: hypothetical protein KAT34_09255 [Candidatus Aminicenantes bacterium]|nr:hypothetical protein [Candidatus Aminicenantes bacterium]